MALIILVSYPSVQVLGNEPSPDLCIQERDHIQRVTDNMARAWRTGNVEDINNSVDYFNLYVSGI